MSLTNSWPDADNDAFGLAFAVVAHLLTANDERLNVGRHWCRSGNFIAVAHCAPAKAWATSISEKFKSATHTHELSAIATLATASTLATLATQTHLH
jgi:hypothetical protein